MAQVEPSAASSSPRVRILQNRIKNNTNNQSLWPVLPPVEQVHQLKSVLSPIIRPTVVFETQPSEPNLSSRAPPQEPKGNPGDRPVTVSPSIPGSTNSATLRETGVPFKESQDKIPVKKPEVQNYVGDVRQRRIQAELAFQNFEKALRERAEMLDRQIAASLGSKRVRQDQELTEFISAWKSEQMRRRYNRASKELKELRDQQNKMILFQRARDAEEVSRMVSEREKMEINAASNAMIRDYSESRTRIEQKHETQLEIAAQAAQRKREEFEYLAERMRQPWSARLRKLERAERESQRIHDLKGRLVSGHVAQAIATRCPSLVKVSPVKIPGISLPPLPLPS
jgi:hypothetical protein